MRIDMHGQAAIVTGAAHRVGRAIALELARAGVNIVLHYHRSQQDVVDEALAEMRAQGVEAFPVQADLSTPEGVEALFAAARERFGRLDILVNSASNFQRRKLMDVTLAEWDETIRINLT